jgi:2-dehydro-3-deoxy-D-arabinonate dehydratase
LKLYKTKSANVLESKGSLYNLEMDWDALINHENLFDFLANHISKAEANPSLANALDTSLLPPIGNQEIWASGVTYFKSREARMDESKDAGGGDFYDRVYYAQRPELFMKSVAHRAVGHKQPVRIRKDSKWNVPEPELTLVINAQGTIIGYTVGNDMSSRDIEGENPLYLPQAKCYNQSAAIGPCIYLSQAPLSPETIIAIEIKRANKQVFKESIPISQIKRSFEELVHYLYLEMDFPYGALLMTGTGIVPPNEFNLSSGDEINISIDSIGTLTNIIA